MESYGLTTGEAQKRLRAYGPNTIAHRQRISALPVLVRQFQSPLIFILLAAGALSGLLLREWINAAIIGATVLMNTLLGFFQEYHAERSFEALQNLLTPRARVIRDGTRMDIDAATLVPGDMVMLEIGRTVPADGELLQATDMTVNEAILTGESGAVGKRGLRDKGQGTKEEQTISDLGVPSALSLYPLSLVFMGTSIVTGIGTMRVTATGDRTKMGLIASSIRSIDTHETPLQREVHRLAGMLGIGVVIIALFIFSTGALLGKSPIELFQLSVAIAVSAIPEGLAVSLTAILAIGMKRIFKHHALVRRLVSAETLGSVTVICADKTGTLTEGKMRVTGMDLVDEEQGKNAIAACNDRRDPLEVAMFDAVKDAEERVKKFPRLAEIPFSPGYKYIATLHEGRAKGQGLRAKGNTNSDSLIPHPLAFSPIILFVSGAPEVLLEKSTLSVEKREAWQKKFRRYAHEGSRLVAVASKSLNAQKTTMSHHDIVDLQWLGIVLFEDPVRPGVARSFREAQRLGLQIKVITGDYRETAEAVLKKIGVANIELFSRVTPEQKSKIVEDLKKQGEVVAMMGDGVNDAPSLKAADISIVVGGASDVAKELADMVLLDNNFRTIVSSIIEGRGISRTFKKVLTYLLSDSLAEVLLILGAFALPVPLPITAIMILWVNLIVDGLPSLALTVEPTRHPVRSQGPILDSKIKIFIAIVSFLKGIFTLLFFISVWQTTHDIALARSASFAMMVTMSLLSVFSLRSLERPITRIDLRSNPWLLASVAVSFGTLLFLLGHPFLQHAFGTTMPGLSQWLAIFGAGGLTLGAIEGVKWGSRIIQIDK